MSGSIIVHTLEDACAAFAAAKPRDTLALQSAPDAAAYAGVVYLKAMVEAAAKEYPHVTYRFTIDCGDDPALALAALRSGHKDIMVAGMGVAAAKIKDMARQTDASIEEAS